MNRAARLLFAATLLLSPVTALGQQATVTDAAGTLDRSFYMGGLRMLRAFEPVVGETYQSVVEVRRDGRIIAYGTVVSADGLVVTKASEIGENDDAKLTCRLHDRRTLDATLLAVDRANDLALLRLDTERLEDALKPIAWPEPEALSQTRVGQWAITVGTRPTPEAVGVVSLPERLVRSQRVLLGVVVEEAENGVRVESVSRGRGAAEAGVRPNDVITHVNDTPVTNQRAIVEALDGYSPGENAAVTVLRGGRELNLEVRLTAYFIDDDPRGQQGEVSQRRHGFPLVIQHDTALHPRDCGGPLLNVEGQVVGLNIARAGRVASYALPTPVAQPAVEALIAQGRALIAEAETPDPAPASEPTEPRHNFRGIKP